MENSTLIFHLHWEYQGKTTIEIPLDNPPDNLEELAREAFRSFTYGTTKEYMDEDKLSFLDNIRKQLNPEDFDEYYREYAHDELDWAIDESDGDFDLHEDVDLAHEFAESCFDKGFKPFKKEGAGRNNIVNHSLVRVIRAVSEYGVVGKDPEA